MIYDAVSMARRGVGADELRLASPTFLDAVRWAAFAERIWPETEELQELARRDATGVPPKDLSAFIGARGKAREAVRARRVMLLLDEPAEASGG